MSTVFSGFTAAGVLGEAVMSDDGVYRYVLNRRWDRSRPVLPWIMLNPSVADEKTDDPTIARCMTRALRAGYGGICVSNLFALRATDPSSLLRHPDPEGPENDSWLDGLASDTGHGAVPVVIAWGALAAPRLREQASRVLGILILGGCRLECLGVTGGGYPRHPCRLGYDVPLRPYS
jgi:hypothetical protein